MKTYSYLQQSCKLNTINYTSIIPHSREKMVHVMTFTVEFVFNQSGPAK